MERLCLSIDSALESFLTFPPNDLQATATRGSNRAACAENFSRSTHTYRTIHFRERPARNSERRPLRPSGVGCCLLRRRLAKRARRAHRVCPSFRAHDVPGFRECAESRALSIHFERRRYEERPDFE